MATFDASGPPLAGEPLSITIDDFPCQYGPAAAEPAAEPAAEILSKLERAFARYPAARPLLFVNSDRMESAGFPIERLARLGLLGNHTASHCDIDSMPLQLWRDDVLRCQRFIDPWLGGQPRFFRFPFLRTGASPPVRDLAYRFLSEQGLIVLPATCPTADWLLSPYYEAARRAGDGERCRRIERGAVRHVLDAVANALSERASSPIPSAPLVLVLHANALLAEIIDALLDALSRLGASLADAPALSSSFGRFNGYDRYAGTWGGSFFLQCSAAGCEALSRRQDWLSRACVRLERTYGSRMIADRNARDR